MPFGRLTSFALGGWYLSDDMDIDLKRLVSRSFERRLIAHAVVVDEQELRKVAVIVFHCTMRFGYAELDILCLRVCVRKSGVLLTPIQQGVRHHSDGGGEQLKRRKARREHDLRRLALKRSVLVILPLIDNLPLGDSKEVEEKLTILLPVLDGSLVTFLKSGLLSDGIPFFKLTFIAHLVTPHENKMSPTPPIGSRALTSMGFGTIAIIAQNLLEIVPLKYCYLHKIQLIFHLDDGEKVREREGKQEIIRYKLL